MHDVEHIGDIIARNFERWNRKSNPRSKMDKMSNEELLKHAEETLCSFHVKGDALSSIAASLLVIAREMSTKQAVQALKTAGVLIPHPTMPNRMRESKLNQSQK